MIRTRACRVLLTLLIGCAPSLIGSAPAMAQDTSGQDGAQVLTKDGDAGAGATSAEGGKVPPPPGWTVQCANPTGAVEGGLRCEATQSIFVMPQRELLVSVSVHVETESKQPTMIVRVPLGVLMDGLQIKVDEGEAEPIKMRVCSMQGCFANAPIKPELLAAMANGKNLTVAFQDVQNQAITVAVPLAGFGPAYQKVQ